MKIKYLIFTATTALLLTTGCGGKDPVIDETATQNQVETVQDDTANATTTQKDETTEVTGEQQVEEAKDSNEAYMESVEAKVKTVYFDFDKFFIKADMQEIIENNAEVLSERNNRDFRIHIEGNCDEWGTDEYNYALGLKRASSAKKALLAQGIDNDRITLISYGEANPTCADKTQECWSKNRRVDFKVRP